ncbi:histidine kinase dimerization/phosphoacceptor domain -containing protein [Mucilaginibacter celer]|uniref:histidine kinase n=1 Tax=Mucilaginibacter celer TaxID=2305508 RepID=A0A494VZ73_9SPHI|nr:histidine kinase dimerization/phosphoacceptor domain -containing protein [Mucilaginibacter celer]AYL96618.1 hypothetical protein HYN43_015505 [Mucilaginibacter celer]
MKKIYLLQLFLLLAISASAQSSSLEHLPIPVLKQKLAESKNDTSTIQLQIALGRVIIHQSGSGNAQADSAFNLSVQAEKLSRKVGYNDGIIDAMLLSALCYNKKGNKAKGFQEAQQTLAFSNRVKNNRGVAESYIVMGHHYDVYTHDGLQTRMLYNNKAITIFRKEHAMFRLGSLLKDEAELLFLAGQKTDAVKLLFEALNIDKSIGNKQIQSVYWLIGRTSRDMGDFTNALKYILLAVKTANEVKDTTLLACSIHYTTAAIYSNLRDYDRAIPNALLALKIARRYNSPEYIGTVTLLLASVYTRANRLDQALVLLEELKKYFIGEPEDLTLMESIFSNLIYAKQFKKAKPYAEKIQLALTKISPDDYSQFELSYSSLAKYYLGINQPEAAKIYNDLDTKIVYASKLPIAIINAERTHYRIDSINGNFKSAIVHYLNAQRLRDSVDNVTKAYQISLLSIENETEKKNNDLNKLKKQAEIKDTKLKQTQLIQKIAITGSVFLLIITALVYSRYRLKQRSNILLTKQKSEIDRQNVSLQQLVGEKDGLLYEKDLLLKEVNHRVKNNLQIVMSLLESQSGYMQNKKAQEAILESQSRVQAIALIHDTLYHTDQIAEIALGPYIADLLDSLNNSINIGRDKILIRYEVDDMMLDVSQAIPVGLILNESVTNALKYAFPAGDQGEITVLVKQSDGEMEMLISDNGVGLPADFDLFKTDSLGLTLIKGLTSQLRGAFDITYHAGVTISIKFPVISTIIASQKSV